MPNVNHALTVRIVSGGALLAGAREVDLLAPVEGDVDVQPAGEHVGG